MKPMTNSVNVSDLAKLAKTLLKENTNGQGYMLSDVCAITRQAYINYPEDPVIRQFAFVVERMAEKNNSGATINQKEMTRIYNDLVRTSENTKFRKVLGMLVFDANLPDNKTASEEFILMNRVDASDTQLSTDEYIDKDLSDTLNLAFGGSINEDRVYDKQAAKKGKEYVVAELKALGFSPEVSVLGGDKNTLVYEAAFDTQKGRVSVAVPISIMSNKLLLPSTFVADDHLEELKSDKLSYFIDKKAFNNNFSVPNVNSIIKAINIMTGQVKIATDNELKENLNRFEDRGEVVRLTTPELFSDKQYEEPKPYIDTTQNVEMPKELAHLAHDFENDLLESVSTFGKDAVRKGKSIVLAELASAGFKNSQVRFGSDSGDSACYMASIYTPKGAVEIEIPVEMQLTANSKYVPLVPSYFAYDGLIEDFTPAKLQSFALNIPQPSTGQVVYSTAHSYMTLPELKNEIIKSASIDDFVSCEMILGTIQERFEDEDYKNIVADYHELLMLKNSMQQERRTCSNPIESGKGSIEKRCSHFGVPMSKVIVVDGMCKLRSTIERERLNPIEEGSASISSSKLYWS